MKQLFLLEDKLEKYCQQFIISENNLGVSNQFWGSNASALRLEETQIEKVKKILSHANTA